MSVPEVCSHEIVYVEESVAPVAAGEEGAGCNVLVIESLSMREVYAQYKTFTLPQVVNVQCAHVNSASSPSQDRMSTVVAYPMQFIV